MKEFGFVERLRLHHAFPDAGVRVILSGALIDAVVVSVLLVAVRLVFLRKARRLEASHAP